MTSSATSAAAFVGNLKAPPAPDRQASKDPAMDGENLSEESFGAAFEAIIRFSKEAADSTQPAQPTPADGSADHLDRSDAEYAAWTLLDGVDGSPAAGDLLLAGGALTPEGNAHGLDARQGPSPKIEANDTAMIAGKAEVSEAEPEAATPAVATNSARVANTVTEDQPPTNTIAAAVIDGETSTKRVAPGADARVVGEQPAPTQPRADPFEGLRNLVRAVDRPSAQARVNDAPSNVMPGPEQSEIRSPGALSEDRLASSSTAADRSNQAMVREPVPAPTANLTVVEARQFPGIAPSQSNTAAIVSAISGNENWHAMLRGGDTIAAPAASRPGTPLNTLMIQLRPAELGSVNAVLRLSGDQLVVEMKVETIEAYRQLSDNQTAIVKALKGQGYAIEQISILQMAVDRPVSQQGNGQMANGAAGQQNHENFTQSNGGQTGRGNSHDDAYGQEGRGPEDLSGGHSSRGPADGAVYL
ncbi:MAG: flagellar hook-length control protein FliK [Alphaproteobacteria bacterium]|nr:flagellar hook-length control protein FliK [Alphaproteobacteria bacterium]